MSTRQATETKLLDFFRKSVQFVIPIYQRTYSWTYKQCNQLWKDIVHAGKNEEVTGHFIGSIVYIEKGLYSHSAIPHLLVIDGQQRLATLSILIAALARAIETQGGSIKIGEQRLSQKKMQNYYLFNSEEDDELRYKVLLTQNDKDTYINLVKGIELPKNSSIRICENNKFFEDKIANEKVSLETIYKGVSKLILVDISLNREHDNPQLIFESLNSTGLELSQADLIRNYILMGLEPDGQRELYSKYWYPMEQNFGQGNYASNFDRFMRDYLTLKTGSIPNIRAVYEEFKKYCQQQDESSVEDVVADIHKYSRFFVNIAFGKETKTSLQILFDEINNLKVHVAYPFLLEAYNDYIEQEISSDEFEEILRLTQSYVFRRAICGIPTNSLNKTFATLSRSIDKGKYLESFKAAMITKDSYRRFPSDEEFKAELLVKDVYHFRNRNFLLSRLENHDRKERVETSGYTIEHIMPQKEDMTDSWKNMLGNNWEEVFGKYLHTFGNLTLTGYNSELSCKPFSEKRDMVGGFADSPIRLNRSLAKLENWNEKQIILRARELAGLAIEVWDCPELEPEIIEQYLPKKESSEEILYSLEDREHLQGSMGEFFMHVRRRILNLDSSVSEEVLKPCIAYKNSTNFVDIVPTKTKLRLHLNMLYEEINDPRGISEDVTGKDHRGNGDVKINLKPDDDIEYAMRLVKQSFDKHFDDGDDL